MGGELTEAQVGALRTLAPALRDDFYLAGGVAVALRLHHRTSRDLDLFATERDPNDLESEISKDASIRITARAPGTLHLDVNGVPVSLLRYGYALLAPTEHDDRVPLNVASREDLVCMKLSAIGGRGARRDFWDLHALLVSSALSLPDALDLFAKKYPTVDRGHVIRALAYFGDADAEPMPRELTPATWASMKLDLEQWVRDLPR